MRAPDDDFPAPPDLPAFTVEDGTDALFEDAPHDIDLAERHAGTGLVRHDATLDEERIDPDAAKVVRRLTRAGHEAYLVGGCVRDLLLGGRPKDFDVATSARPEEVRNLFRNCRIIGRRFRLAHVLFGGGKVIEVATFRRSPQNATGEEDSLDSLDDLLIRSDNVFGHAHEDALRRDFTINALFYDLERRQALDWCGGMQDVERRVVRTIGDPWVRFREDPVRILRAIKFSARLDLGISPEVVDAMVGCREDLSRAAKPRIFEEILRLLRGGASHRSMWLLWEMGALALLIPELSAFLDDDDATSGGAHRFWRKLDAVDVLTEKRRAPLDDVTLLMALLQEPLEEATFGEKDRMRGAGDFLEPIVHRINMPRRHADTLRRMHAMLPRVQSGRFPRTLRSEFALPLLDALEVDCLARGRDVDFLHRLREEMAPQRAASRPFARRASQRPRGNVRRTGRG